MVRARWVGVALGVLLLASAGTALAQEGDPPAEGTDVEARSLFEAGRAAFADGRYEEALGHFRRSYELSGRPQLLYNIGVAADRLRRDREALEAFEGFLAGGPPDGPEVVDARSRVAILREQVASEATTTPPPVGDPVDTDEGSGGPGVAPWLVAGAGVAVLAVPILGIATAGGCAEEVGGTCVRETEVNPVTTGLYVALGVGALVGGILWYLMSGDDTPSDERAERTDRRMAW